jgi:hypothetical protein
MRAFGIIALLLLLPADAFALEPDANARLAESARTLDWRAQQSLGLSIQHLALLLQAGPGEFFRKNTLEQNGSWALIKQLETGGFVTVSESSMPGGPLGNSMVSYTATPKGQAIITALRRK